MPFGLGPYGWFMFPWFSYWFYTYWYPWMWSWYRPFGYPGWGTPVMSREEELRFLQDQQKSLEEQLNDIKRRIEELSKK